MQSMRLFQTVTHHSEWSCRFFGRADKVDSELAKFFERSDKLSERTRKPIEFPDQNTSQDAATAVEEEFVQSTVATFARGQSQMARSSECTPNHVQRVLDSVAIVKQQSIELHRNLRMLCPRKRFNTFQRRFGDRPRFRVPLRLDGPSKESTIYQVGELRFLLD